MSFLRKYTGPLRTAARKKLSAIAVAVDAYFNYVTMLLHGDGTNGAQNNTFLDSSTNAFSITRNGNTTQGSFSPYGPNWSNAFDGTGDYLTSSCGSVGTGNFTIEGWFYFNATPSTMGLFQASSTSGGFAPNQSANLAVATNTSSTWQIYAKNTFTTSSSTSVPVGAWAHMALVRNGTTTVLYINGAVVITLTSDSTNYSTSFIGLGGIYNNSSYLLNGYLSNFRVVVGTAVYTAAFTPPTTPLTAITNTSLLTCQSNRFIDNSASPLTITVNGNTSVQRFNPFGTATAYDTSVIGGSGYFDGNGDKLQATAGAVPAIGSSDFTISGSWYLNELVNYQILFDFRNGTGTEAVPYLYVTSSGSADYYVNGTSHNFSSTLQAKQWLYIVISRVSGTTKVFLNGTEVVSYSDSVTYVAGRLTLGVNNGGGGTDYYYNGYISDFKVVIGTGTTSGTPTTSPATATSGTQALLSMTNGAIFDNAMMNDLETVGNAQISTSVKKYGTGSLAFDGTGDYLKIPYSSNLQFGTGAYTLEFWLNTSSVSQWLVFNAENNSGIRFYVQSNGTLELDEQVANVDNNIYSTATVNDGAWHHIALSRASGAGTKMFVDGVYQSQQASAYNFNDSVPYYIGTRSNLSGFLTGYIDDLRITKGYARYTATFTPPTAAFPNTGPY